MEFWRWNFTGFMFYNLLLCSHLVHIKFIACHGRRKFLSIFCTRWIMFVFILVALKALLWILSESYYCFSIFKRFKYLFKNIIIIYQSVPSGWNFIKVCTERIVIFRLTFNLNNKKNTKKNCSHGLCVERYFPMHVELKYKI